MRVVPLAAIPSAFGSPLSSETTAFHTVLKPEPGSSVNDASPWSDVEVQPLVPTTVHMIIHRCGKDGREASAAYRQRLAISALETIGGVARAASRSAILASLSTTAPVETALPEVNSFPSGCQQFCCIPVAFFTPTR